MKKRFKNNFISLFLLLFIFLFVFVFINESFARAGGGFGGGFGGGGGGGFGGYSGGRGGDFPLFEDYKYIGKHYGYSIALSVYLSFLIFNIVWFVVYCYYAYEKNSSRSFFIIIYLFSFCYFLLYSSFYVILFLPIQIYFLFKVITYKFKYGRFINKNEEAKIQFEKSYKLNGKSVIQNFESKNPTFLYKSFKERIIKAFRIIQDAWMKQDLSIAENFLADGTYEQFQIQINGMKAEHTVDIMAELEILNVIPVKTESSIDYDAIYVAIQAKAINYLENQKTSEKLYGDSLEPAIFCEVWCFMRRKGVKELNSRGLIEGYCPNCGTKIEGSRLVSCPSCNAFLKSGQHDWILAGIYQFSSWRDTHNENIPGLKALYYSDPSFNIQNIEDKLAAFFWRMVEAIRNKSDIPIAKISSRYFVKRFINSSFEHMEIPIVYRVGTDSISILSICKDGNKNLLLGEIEWNYSSMNDRYDTEHKKSVFILQRDINAKTDIRKCFCCMHCSNCGALETIDDRNYCSYCNSVSNDDTKDWILTEIINGEDKKIGFYKEKSYEYDLEIINKIQNSNNKIEEVGNLNKADEEERVVKVNSKTSIVEDDDFEFNSIRLFGKYSIKNTLRICIAVMLADGKIDDNELAIIRKICKKGFISEEDLQKYIRELQGKDNPTEYVLKTAAIELDKDLFKLLIQIAASDGNIDKSESDFIYNVAKKTLFPKEEVSNLINKYSKKNS